VVFIDGVTGVTNPEGKSSTLAAIAAPDLVKGFGWMIFTTSKYQANATGAVLPHPTGPSY
jgi:hypothetical protein